MVHEVSSEYYTSVEEGANVAGFVVRVGVEVSGCAEEELRRLTAAYYRVRSDWRGGERRRRCRTRVLGRGLCRDSAR